MQGESTANYGFDENIYSIVYVDIKFYNCFVERLSNLLGVVLLLRMETYAVVPTEISFARVILLIHLETYPGQSMLFLSLEERA